MEPTNINLLVSVTVLYIDKMNVWKWWTYDELLCLDQVV